MKKALILIAALLLVALASSAWFVSRDRAVEQSVTVTPDVSLVVDDEEGMIDLDDADAVADPEVVADSTTAISIELGDTVVDGDREFGNVYLTDAEGVRAVIGEMKTVENGLAAKSFDQVLYRKATLSPDNRFVMMEGACWEDQCLFVYDIENESLKEGGYFLVFDAEWSDDGLIRVTQAAQEPFTSEAFIYESSGADAPWDLIQIKELQEAAQ